ncbi:ATP-binding protein [Streptomyces sp. NPDC049555]|uniref:ATP-binding protein n=1 Tax=Streptomyces sp. NPDC049555 TaxID=3154930 RepID=UPI00343E617D
MNSASAVVSSDTADVRRVRRWKRHPRTVALARAELRAALRDWDLTEIEDTAVLVLSEIVSNAIRWARVPVGREIETSFCRGADSIRLAVDDADETWPRPRHGDGTGGRGLALVDKLSHRWGVQGRRGVGKSVWAEVTVPGERWSQR